MPENPALVSFLNTAFIPVSGSALRHGCASIDEPPLAFS